MTGIRNPATERADRILDLLDNPTQRSTERGFGRRQAPEHAAEEYHAAVERVTTRVRAIVEAGATEAEAIGAVTVARQVGATDPWVAEQVALRAPRTCWSMLNWAPFLDDVADRPDRDNLADTIELAGVSPQAMVAAIRRIGVAYASPPTADDLLALNQEQQP